MDKWDDEKLRNVVDQNAKKQSNATDVSSIIFLRFMPDDIDRLQILYSGYRGQEVWLVVSCLALLTCCHCSDPQLGMPERRR